MSTFSTGRHVTAPTSAVPSTVWIIASVVQVNFETVICYSYNLLDERSNLLQLQLHFRSSKLLLKLLQRFWCLKNLIYKK